MLRVILWIFSFLVGTSCSHLLESDGTYKPQSPRAQVFRGSYEQIWRAAQIAIQDYPIRINNMDRGLLETEIIKGDQRWSPPDKPIQKNGLKYKISLKVIKGSLPQTKAVKVIVHKINLYQADFFSDQENIPSNGLEELSILYRIERELTVEKALRKFQKRKNS